MSMLENREDRWDSFTAQSPYVARTVSIHPVSIDLAVLNDRLKSLRALIGLDSFLILNGDIELSVRYTESRGYDSRNPGYAFCSVVVETYTYENNRILLNMLNSGNISSILLKTNTGKEFRFL